MTKQDHANVNDNTDPLSECEDEAGTNRHGSFMGIKDLSAWKQREVGSSYMHQDLKVQKNSATVDIQGSSQ